MSRAFSFKGRAAPCGRIVDGEEYRDEDEEVLLTNDLRYACGCWTVHREYHDGSVAHKVVHHSGKILRDELLPAK